LTSLSFTKLFVIILHWNFDIFFSYNVIRYNPTPKHLTSPFLTKLFVIILHWNIWHLYLLQGCSSSSYTKTFDIFILNNVIRHHPSLKHFTSLSLTKLFVIIRHWNIWQIYLLHSYSSSSYTKTFNIFIFYKAIRHHPTLKHLNFIFHKAIRLHRTL
jgi:hypothetical protein